MGISTEEVNSRFSGRVQSNLNPPGTNDLKFFDTHPYTHDTHDPPKQTSSHHLHSLPTNHLRVYGLRRNPPPPESLSCRNYFSYVEAA